MNKDLKLSIIVADDKVINIEVMKVNMNSLNVAKSVEYCFNGKEALQIAIN
jgi:CheY-like chemotaxis protein